MFSSKALASERNIYRHAPKFGGNLDGDIMPNRLTEWGRRGWRNVNIKPRSTKGFLQAASHFSSS